MKIKRYHIIIFLIVLLSGMAKAQDPQFSQFYAAPLYLGPSFAGVSEGTRFGINFRDQWPGVPGKFITQALSIDHYISEYKSGVGLLIMRDNAGGGKLTLNNFTGQYCYVITLSNLWRIRPGLQFSYLQRKVDFSKLSFGDQYGDDGTLAQNTSEYYESQPGHFDFGTSVLMHSKDYWFGFSVDHLVKANPSFTTNETYSPLKYTVFAGANIPIERASYKRDQKKLLFAFHFKSQGTSQQLDFGTYYQRLRILIGAWYRGIPLFSEGGTHDAITLVAGYEINSISFGYSYDLTISSLMMKTGGAHEISVSYVLDQQFQKRRRKITPVPCPLF